jgi:hypothetical protein
LIFGVALFCVSVVKAQAPDYNDLNILFADEKYEKLVGAAEKYTTNDKTKADALPYFWMARGLYKVSQSGTDNEKFKNAYKDAVGVIAKCIKFDKDGKVREEYNEFFTEFENSLIEMISNDLAANQPKKAQAWIPKYMKIYPKSPGAKLLEGACKFKNSDKGGANTNWKEADALLKDVSDFSSLSESEKNILKIGIFQTVECYTTSKQTEKAKVLLGKVSQWYEGDAEFKEKYDAVVNGVQ